MTQEIDWLRAELAELRKLVDDWRANESWHARLSMDVAADDIGDAIERWQAQRRDLNDRARRLRDPGAKDER